MYRSGGVCIHLSEERAGQSELKPAHDQLPEQRITRLPSGIPTCKIVTRPLFQQTFLMFVPSLSWQQVIVFHKRKRRKKRRPFFHTPAPMSVVHHAIPLSCVLRPACTETFRLAKCEDVSPLHNAAPQRCMPAHADRVSMTTSLSPAIDIGSVRLELIVLSGRCALS